MSLLFKSLALATSTTLSIVAMNVAAQAQTMPNLRQGMPYDQARQMILEAGWRPIEVNRASRGELLGFDTYVIDDLGYTEMTGCAATGLVPCTFEYEGDGNTKLVVISTGQILHLDEWWLEDNR
ncbi:MAG: PASTA domain-containing protein [Elainellaceae cyanobacterium]